MTSINFTRFPNLYHLENAQIDEASRYVGHIDVANESILLAWASLLSAYSGEDEEVAFISNHAVIKVDLATLNIEILDSDKIDKPSSRSITGVYFGKVGIVYGLMAFASLTSVQSDLSQNLALELFYEDGAVTIVSHGCVPLSHLEQLEIQLRGAIKYYSSGADAIPGTILDDNMILSIANQEPQILPGPKFLHSLVDWSTFSSRSAIEFWDSSRNSLTVTYSELSRQSDDLAARIYCSHNSSSASIQPVIPLLIPQSPNLYVAMLAVLKTGCAFCPIHLDVPSERLRFILEDISATLVLTIPNSVSKLSGLTGVKFITIGDQPTNDFNSNGFEIYPVQPTDCAYVMYTSGSTGKPKGVPVSHQAASQSLLAHDNHIPRFSRFLQFAAPTFDVSLFEIFFTLFKGSTIVSCDRSDLLSDLPAAMRRMNVDAAELTPTVAASLLQRRSHVPSLKLLLTIGEMLTPPVIEEFGGSEKQESILWGMYGPTEAAIHCTLQTAFSSNSRPTNIGYPLDTVSTFVVAPLKADEQQPNEIKVLPLGHVGELAVGGYQLADGYMNRPKQTAEAFISTKAYGRLYRTGDRARMLPNSSIECLGRISSGQVKLRGQRIELGEIQYAATRVNGCRDAVVDVIAGTLVAFCLVEEDVSAQDIIATCRQWLPSFMVPGDVVLRTEYPCLPSGKVDRRQLEEEYLRQQEFLSGSTEEIDDKRVQQICEIIAQTLGRQVISTATLASLGLDSLSAIHVAGTLRRNGFSVTPVELLSAGSAIELLEHLDLNLGSTPYHQHRQVSESQSKIKVSEIQSLVYESRAMQALRQNIAQISPCTPLQLSMLAETTKDPSAYCNVVKLEFPTSCTLSVVETCLQELVMRNCILRSGFCRLKSSMHPFALITWTALAEDQILLTDAPVHDFNLNSESSFLRPVRFQILTNEEPGHNVHRVLVHLHHAVYDGWSMDLILTDLSCLVQGLVPEERPQFQAVVEHFASSDPSISLDYWQEHMNEFHPNTMPNFNGQVLEDPQIEWQDFQFELSFERLQQYATAHSIGSQAYFQAALVYILHSYLGTPDITIGNVTSGRMIPVTGIEAIIGPCVTSLPLRVNVSRSRSIADLLRSIHTLNREMLQHAGQPLRDIKRACGLTAVESLWDVLFVWQETLESRKQIERVVKIVDSSDKLESILTLEVEPKGNMIFGKATYHSSHFSRAQVLLMLRQIDALVSIFIDTSITPLADLNSMLPANILSIANPHPAIPYFEFGLTKAVEDHAWTSPDRCAVLFLPSTDSTTMKSLTYAELNSNANRLAHLLHNYLEPFTELVCICMEKSVHLYTTILAVLKTGRGYLPITPTTPRERIKTILSEAKITLCLVDSGTSATLHLEGYCKIMNVVEEDVSELPADNFEVPYDGSRIAYAVFTSGSTGTPKGVLVTQQNLLSNLKVLSEIYPSFPNARLLQACSHAFDVSVFEIFFSWYIGICLCSATNDVLFHDLEHNIRVMEITHLSLTPTVAALIDPRNIPEVRFLVTAGEAVSAKVKGAWAGKGLYQGYGPSETTNICTVKSQVSVSDMINNIGPVLKNTSAFVCDPSNNEILPRGALGELCFGGDQVFRGYLNNEELTAQKIINHQTYGRLYKSGDTGRLLSDGSILFAGRIDDQVKIRGQRVELGEISRCLLQIPRIIDSVTIVIDDNRTNSHRLVSFWTVATREDFGLSIISASPEIAAIIDGAFENLIAILPSYMIPIALIPITTIPMTSQGKVDKRALRNVLSSLDGTVLESMGRKVEQDREQGEWTQPEQTIAQAVSRIVKLPMDAIKRHTSFFSLGLDSISAISLAKSLQEEGQPPILVSTILGNPTVARLAKKQKEMQSRRQQITPDLSIIFNQETRNRIYAELAKRELEACKVLPCTPLQESMLSTNYSASSSMFCNTLLLQVHCDLANIEKAWRFMASRHELLRTCFVSTDNLGYPFAQVVLVDHTPHWTLRHVTGQKGVHNLARRAIDERLSSPVDSYEPPYFLGVIQYGSTNILQFSCHHAIQDGAATALLLREIELYCRGIPLPIAVPYEPFLQQMVGHRSKGAITFWKEKMKGFQPLLLNTQSSEHDRFSQPLKLPLSTVENMCKQLGISLLSLSQAAWAKVLVNTFEQCDICFGNVVSGRTLPLEDLECLVAPTFNTLPVRIDTGRLRSNETLLKYVQDYNIDALNYQLIPLRTIQSELGFGGGGLFSTLLLLQQPQPELDSKTWTLEDEFGEMDVR
jgi:amino acid adenylation domain-containing protein